MTHDHRPPRTGAGRVFLAGAFLVMMLVVPGERLPARPDEGDEETRSFQAIDPKTQLIPAPTAGLPLELERLLVWPSAASLATRRAPDDRSARLAPVLPRGGPPDSKPIVYGGISPQAALEEAEIWIRKILEEEWIPPDLSQRLIPRQADEPQWSSVICRYARGGTAIQITQTRWAITVVIREDARRAIAAADAGPRIFERFFTEGERMSNLAFAVPSATPGAPALFTLDEGRLESPEALESWWGTASWITEGDATAVVMRKRIAGEMHTPQPGEPWF